MILTEKYLRHSAVALLSAFFINGEASIVNLSINTGSNYNQVNMAYDSATGVYDIGTTGTDPHFNLSTLPESLGDDADYFTFEYQCPGGTDFLQIFFANPLTEERSVWGPGLHKTASGQWNRYILRIAEKADEFSWGSRGNYFRVDPGNKPGYTMSIRNIRIGSAAELGVDMTHSVGLDTSDNGSQDVSITENSGVYTVTTSGSAPWVQTTPLETALYDDFSVISFEYQCPQSIEGMQYSFRSNSTRSWSEVGTTLSPTSGSQWARCDYICDKARLYNPVGTTFRWGDKGDAIRLYLGFNDGITMKIRNLHMRPLTAQEWSDLTHRNDLLDSERRAMAQNIRNYLNSSFTSRVSSVKVNEETVTISGNIPDTGDFRVADIAPWEDVTELRSFDSWVSVNSGDFTVSLPRYVTRGGYNYDRSLSKWVVINVSGSKQTPVSHARYADEVAELRTPKSASLISKKGVGAGSGNLYYHDFDNLDLHSITMNVFLDRMIVPEPEAGFTNRFDFGGRSYWISPSEVMKYDEVCQAAYGRNMMVNAIILTGVYSAFRDPENNGGYYTMPNMTTPEAVNLYAAGLTYLADRYSLGAHGRVHNWIVHNEVDIPAEWTNMGDQPQMRYFDRYMKSLRMCYNILRQYDPNANVLLSFAHSWNLPDTDYTTRLMLEQTLKYSATEGDFKWGVAYHPYPLVLAVPDFWRNDVAKATFSNDTENVTLLNPEVINAWILNPDHFYKGNVKRMLLFSEQGTNSSNYTDEILAKQAAGAAWIWKKLQKLDGVDAMMWHNWKDSRSEFGLRIGLRAFDEGNFADNDPKPVWHVWQAAGTDKEDEVFRPYLDVIGISSWDNIIKPVK